MKAAVARFRLPALKLGDRLGGSTRAPALNAWRATVARWLEQRSPRERLSLIVLAVVAAAVAYWGLVWRPLDAARTAAQAEIARYDRLSAQLRLAGPDVARMAAARTGGLSAIVTDSAAKARLAIQRIEPQGRNIGVTMDAVPFEALIGWLAGLEREAGLRVVDLKVERRPNPGIVNVQLTLTG